jgi:4-alpha-glucanotransferase
MSDPPEMYVFEQQVCGEEQVFASAARPPDRTVVADSERNPAACRNARNPAQPFDDRARDLLLAALYAAPSTLALIPFQDAMGTRERINVPGTVNETNWRYRAARAIDDLSADRADIERLQKLAAEAGRL